MFDPITTGELDQARTLTRSLRAGMLLLADRNYAAADILTTLAATGADPLIRCKNSRRLPVITRYRDGSWLATIGTLRVRVIDAQITIKTSDGTRTAGYRLITTLLDHHRYPASDLIKLYHRRWEIETAYLEITSSILGGRVLLGQPHFEICDRTSSLEAHRHGRATAPGAGWPLRWRVLPPGGRGRVGAAEAVSAV